MNCCLGKELCVRVGNHGHCAFTIVHKMSRRSKPGQFRGDIINSTQETEGKLCCSRVSSQWPRWENNDDSQENFTGKKSWNLLGQRDKQTKCTQQRIRSQGKMGHWSHLEIWKWKWNLHGTTPPFLSLSIWLWFHSLTSNLFHFFLQRRNDSTLQVCLPS